jgi:membrane dipeptidase
MQSHFSDQIVDGVRPDDLKSAVWPAEPPKRTRSVLVIPDNAVERPKTYIGRVNRYRMATDRFDLADSEAERARRLHRESVVVDGLVATRRYLSDPDYQDHLAAGGIDAANVTVASYRDDFQESVESVAEYGELAEEADGHRLVESVAELRAAERADEVGVVLGFQDTRPIGPDLSRLRTFEAMGVRVVQLTYNDQNYVGAGCCERHDAGLSNFGRELVAECNDRNLLVDLSHCADATTLDAIAASDDPVACTHVGTAELVDATGRNKTDEQLRAVAANGGVVGITFFPPLVKRKPGTREVAEATVEDVLDHVDHAIDVAGVDHVGFGTDLNDHALDVGTTPPDSSLRHYRPDHPDVFGLGPVDTYDPYPSGVHRHTELETFTRGLVARGYDDEEIEGILGENFLRVLEEVWGS